MVSNNPYALDANRDVGKHWWDFTCREFEVRSRSGTAYLGVDGEALEVSTPLEFEIHPGGLLMLVPRGNLHAAEQRRAMDRPARRVLEVVAGRNIGPVAPGRSV